MPPSARSYVVHLRTCPDGRLGLVTTDTDESGRSTRWHAMATGGVRDITFDCGTVIHDGHAEPQEQAIEIATGRLARNETDPEEAGEAIDLLCEAALRRRSEPEFARFSAVCGPTTLSLSLWNEPLDALVRLDNACGHEEIERLFAQWPFLLGPLADMESGPEEIDASTLAGGGGAGFYYQGGAGGAGGAGTFVIYPPVPPDPDVEEPDPGSAVVDVQDDVHLLAVALCRYAFGTAEADEDRVATLLKRMRGVDVVRWPTASLRDVLILTRAVPLDWLPSDRDGFVAFAACARTIVGIAEPSSGALDVATLAASSKGRWGEFRDRMAPFCVDGDGSDVKDMVAAFRRQMAFPALLHASVYSDPAVRYDAALRANVGDAFPEDSAAAREHHRAVYEAMQAPAWPIGHEALRAGKPGDERGDIAVRMDLACWRLLFSNKSAPAVLESSKLWHRMASAMDGAIGTMLFGDWKAPFGPIAIADDAELVPIIDAVSLASEGATLRHCVGGADYVARCAARKSVIASIRRTNPDGSVVATSTVELSGWKVGEKWKPTVVQHRAFNNTAASGDDAHCLKKGLEAIALLPPPSLVSATSRRHRPPITSPADWWGDLIEEARLRVAGNAKRGRSSGRPDPVTRSARYDWLAEEPMQVAFTEWERFLGREVRASGIAGFPRHVAEAAGEDLVRCVAEIVAETVARHRPAGPGATAMAVLGALADRIAGSAIGRLVSQLAPPVARA